MAFEIAHTVFALSVVLITRLVEDVGARSAYAFVMRIRVTHVDDDPASAGALRGRRHQATGLVWPDAA